MANPAVINCNSNVWRKVATNVQTGNIWLMDFVEDSIYHTYRLTGQAAPSDLTDAIKFTSHHIEINHSVGIDVYVYPQDRAVKVRVDL